MVPATHPGAEIGRRPEAGWLVATGRAELQTGGDGSILDLTAPIAEFLARNGADNGILVAFVPGSTAALTTIEYEAGALEDLRRAIGRIAPQGLEYAHDRRWGDGNGFSHVRSALIGPSISLPVEQGRAVLGTWQQVVLCDFDNRPRSRTVLLKFVGRGSESG